MKKLLLGSAAAAALFLAMGATAHSADVVPEPVAAIDWSGFYIGGHLGYGWANMSGCFECADSDPFDASELDLEGIIGGVHAGYNSQMDGIVLGVEVDLSFADIDDAVSPPGDGSDTDEDQSGEVDLLASVRARLGVAFDDVLLYVTGGIAIPDAEWRIRKPGDDVDEKRKFGEIGGVVGGGVEFALNENIRLRGEGLYYFFDEGESVEDIPTAGTGEEIEFDDIIVVRGGVSFYFN